MDPRFACMVLIEHHWMRKSVLSLSNSLSGFFPTFGIPR
jgi:hypothetical protein